MNILLKKLFNLMFLVALAGLSVAGYAADSIEKPEAKSAVTADLLTYDRLYTGDDGHTHFDQTTVNYTLIKYAKDTPAVWVESGGPRPAKNIQFIGSPTGWDASKNHPAPRRQFFIILSGIVAFTASDGETRHYQAGDVLLLEDVSGIGHASYTVSQTACLVAAIPLAD